MVPLNIAQQIRNYLGCADGVYVKQGRNHSFTKKGPGRVHLSMETRQRRKFKLNKV